MREITLEQLLEAGCHFGHQVTRSNPKARDFIFEARDNIHIIDLAKTKQGLEEAGEFIRNLAKTGGTLLIVGSKRQARDIVAKQLERIKEVDPSFSNTFFILEKWIGGTLTNFSQISQNLKKLKELTERLGNAEEKVPQSAISLRGTKYTKKEVGLWEKERQRLSLLYGGLVNMTNMPGAVYIIDSHLEALAVKEAQILNVPTVAIVDTNADPLLIDYPIPANDDAVGSIEIITSYIIDAWIEGLRSQKTQRNPQKKNSVVARKV